MSNIMIIIWVVGGGLFTLIVVGLIIKRMYRRASKEISFVRTGFGGQKVVMNGGALEFPVLHETIPVNMNTLRLMVLRANEQALITRDRMRVDVQSEFYVRVKPTEEAIASAAQTLGQRTMNPDLLKELVEGKFVDALRAVAAEMAMEELHEQRVDFVQKVQTAVTEDLLKNGLELEAVSLTSLDQTEQSFFNPQNIFDAQGLTKLTEEIENRKKQRNDIERDNEVLIQKKNLEAERQKLILSKEQEYARLEQQREIEVRRAEQQSEIAKEQAGKMRIAKEAEINANQQVDRAQIESERAVDESRITKERHLKEKDIERTKVIETAEIERQKSVTLADQDRDIAIAEKSKDKSVTQAEADEARALAVKAEEQVITTRETEIAERAKAIELVEASKQAEREAIAITVAAEAEKKASIDKADAVRTFATGEADKVKIGAQAEADAIIVRAEAAEKQYAVDAEGSRALHEAENILDPAIIAMRIKMSIIEHLDKIIHESVEPMKAIEGIKIIQVDGLNLGGRVVTNGEGSGDSATVARGNLADQVINSALRYRGQAPLLDALLKEIGLTGGDISGLTRTIKTDTSGSDSVPSSTETDSDS